MSQFNTELAELVDRFCEGDIAPEQAARLEALVATSDEAKQYLADCFQIHCELTWEFGRRSEDSALPPPNNPDPVVNIAGPAVPSPKRKRLPGWALAAMAVALLVTVALGLGAFFRSGSHPAAPHRQSVAHVHHATDDVRWSDVAAPAIDAPLPAGSKLAIQQGLVKVVFDGGAEMVLHGPAEVELQSSSSAFLRRGSLTAEVAAEARGFAVHTPNSTVVDLGTRFEVACQTGQTYVEVLEGKILLRLDDTESGGSPQELRLAANQASKAVRVHGVPGTGALRIEQLPAGSPHFSSP